MAKYATGKHAYAMDQRTGMRVRYKDLRTEWNGVRVHKSEWEPKHPQLEPVRNVTDAQALRSPVPDTDSNDTTLAINHLRYGHAPFQITMTNNISGIVTSVCFEATAQTMTLTQANLDLGGFGLAGFGEGGFGA